MAVLLAAAGVAQGAASFAEVMELSVLRMRRCRLVHNLRGLQDCSCHTLPVENCVMADISASGHAQRVM
jgi:hypothetical protein